MKSPCLYRCFILIILFFPGLLRAYEPPGDSLKKVIDTAGSPYVRAMTLLKLANLVSEEDFDQAIQYYNQAKSICEKNNYEDGLMEIFTNMAIIYSQKGEYDLALFHGLKGLKLAESMHDTVNIGDLTNTIGNIFRYLKNYPKAHEYYNRSLEIVSGLKDSSAIAGVNNSIGLLFWEEKDFDEAIRCFTFARDLSARLNNPYGVASGLGNLALVYDEMGDKHKALSLFKECMEILRPLEIPQAMIISHNNIADIYSELGNKDLAVTYADSALRLAKELNLRDDVKESYRILSEIYNRSGDYKNAYDYSRLYFMMYDSLNNEERIKQTAEMNAKYESDKKEKELILNKAELEKSNAENRQKTQLAIGLVAGILLMVVLAALAARAFYIKRNANRIISEQKSLVEQKNTEITDSIQYASRIQTAILPPDDYIYEVLRDSFVFYRPKDIVSGDFYFVSGTVDRVYFAAVDCTGHGVPGAFMSMLGNSALNLALKELKDPSAAEVLEFMSANLVNTFRNHYDGSAIRDGMDMSLCVLDRKNGSLQFAGAQNPLYMVTGNVLKETKGTKRPIGADVEGTLAKPFQNHTHAPEKGSMVYLFSDGYADQFGGPDKKKFKYSRFKELLTGISSMPTYKQKSELENRFSAWKGELEQIDDVLVIGVRI